MTSGWSVTSEGPSLLWSPVGERAVLPAWPTLSLASVPRRSEVAGVRQGLQTGGELREWHWGQLAMWGRA